MMVILHDYLMFDILQCLFYCSYNYLCDYHDASWFIVYVYVSIMDFHYVNILNKI